MRLIDAEQLPLDACVCNTFISFDYASGYNDMLKNVLTAKVVEAEEVVRCKNCMKKPTCKHARSLGINGYCSEGKERKQHEEMYDMRS